MAKAGRLYLQLDVNYHEDARLVDVSPLAELLYIRCLCVCKRLVTDGVLSNTQINKIGLDIIDISQGEEVSSLTNELLSVGLLEGDRVSWMTIRSWGSWNRSVEDLEEVSAARSAAGRAGGLRSGESRSKTKQLASDGRTKLVDHDEANETWLRSQSRVEKSRVEKSSSSAKSRKTTAPDDFEITPHLREWAGKSGISIDLETETQNFLDHHASKGSEMVSWDRAWQKWMRTGNGWAKERKPNSDTKTNYVPANQMTPEQVQATYAGMPVAEWPSE